MFVKKNLILIIGVLCTNTYASPWRETVPIQTEINLPTGGAGLNIELDKDAYSTLYNRDVEMFDPIDIPFRVSSDLVNADRFYSLELIESYHLCEGVDIVVDSYLDNVLINKSDEVRNIPLDNKDSTHSYHPHSFKLIFPTISQTSESITCQGNIIFNVGIQI